jgi:hypothetical protein
MNGVELRRLCSAVNFDPDLGPFFAKKHHLTLKNGI